MHYRRNCPIVLAGLLLFPAARVTLAGAIDYLKLNASSSNPSVQAGAVFSTVSYDSLAGASSNTGTGGSATYSVPTAFGLTDATVQAVTASTDILNNATLTASSWASGNLATGSVGVYAFPSLTMIGTGANSTTAIASARMDDSLTFTVAGAGNSTVTDIGVNFTVDGAVSPGTTSLGAGVLADYSFVFGDGNIDYVYDTADNPPSFSPTSGGWVTSSVTSESPDSLIFSGTYALSGASDTLPISMLLSLDCVGDSSCDVSHTGAVTFLLPSDVTFTSQSGVFLTSAAAAPEPGYPALAGFGLILMGFAAQRRRAAKTV